MRLKALALVAFLLVVNTACSEFGAKGTSPVAPTSQDLAAKPPKPSSDIPVTTYIEPLDGNGLPADTLGDGLGAYVHGAGGVSSVLTANAVNGLTHGDWRFTASATGRKFGIAFDLADAVQPGEPAYLVPATPPYWGTQLVPGNINVQCTFVNNSMKTMTAGASFECPLATNFVFNGITYHKSAMHSFYDGHPETTDVQVVCNAADAGGCNDWFIEPIGQDPAIARLGRQNKHPKPNTHIGTFYVRFRIHVTRP
jgi:hypothetical protein